MATKTTAGIVIIIDASFNDKLSYLEDNSFVFEYHIQIKNSNPEAVQLLSREWLIFDSLNNYSRVEGLGVIGEQPILKLNETHSYTSYCELKSEVGYMEGYYTFVNLSTNQRFRVAIPRFYLNYPGKLN